MHVLKGYYKDQYGMLTRSTLDVEYDVEKYGDRWLHAEMGWEVFAQEIENSAAAAGKEIEITGFFLGSFVPDTGECERIGMPVDRLTERDAAEGERSQNENRT